MNSTKTSFRSFNWISWVFANTLIGGILFFLGPLQKIDPDNQEIHQSLEEIARKKAESRSTENSGN